MKYANVILKRSLKWKPDAEIKNIFYNSKVLRLVQAFQFTDTNGEVCPASWKPGDATIKPDVEGAKEYFDTVVDDETLEYLDAGFKKLQVIRCLK